MPKLNEESKKAIHNALFSWEWPLREGAEPAHILHQIERYVTALLELPEESRKYLYELEEKQ
jgi:hypothetical protein